MKDFVLNERWEVSIEFIKSCFLRFLCMGIYMYIVYVYIDMYMDIYK